MTNPAENKGEIVPSVDADKTLDKLEANEPMPSAFKMALFPVNAYAVAKGEPLADPVLRAEAESLGFRYAGLFSFAAFFFMRKRRECWIDPAGIIKLSLRPQKSLDPFEAALSPFLLTTMFDDGSMIVTWGNPNVQVPSGDRVTDRAGTGNLTTDHATHLRLVEERIADGHRALSSQNLVSHLRISEWDDSRLRPGVASIRLQARAVSLMMVVSILYYFWLRHLWLMRFFP